MITITFRLKACFFEPEFVTALKFCVALYNIKCSKRVRVQEMHQVYNRYQNSKIVASHRSNFSLIEKTEKYF